MAYIQKIATTAARALLQYPYLKELFAQAGVKGAKKIYIADNGDMVRIKPPICDYYVRFISCGDTGGYSIATIYGGTSDVPQDILCHNVEGEKQLATNNFFAILDKGNNQVWIDLYIGKYIDEANFLGYNYINRDGEQAHTWDYEESIGEI